MISRWIFFKKFQDHATKVFTSDPFHKIQSYPSPNKDNSFYVVSYTTKDEGRKIRWIIKFRISDHTINKALLTKENLLYIRRNHADSEFSEDSIYYNDFDVVLKIRGRVKSVNDKNINFALIFDGDTSNEVHCKTIEEVHEQVDEYAARAYNECNQKLMDEQDKLVLSSVIPYYDTVVDLDDIDLDDLVNMYLTKLHNTKIPGDYVYADHWICTGAHFEDDYQTIVLDIQDNHGNEFYLETEIDLEYYIKDTEYRDDLIEDLVNITFEYYEQCGLIYV